MRQPALGHGQGPRTLVWGLNIEKVNLTKNVFRAETETDVGILHRVANRLELDAALRRGDRERF